MATLSNPRAIDTIDTINDLPKGIPYPPRHVLERRLLRKLDLHMSILLILQIMNLVGPRFLRTLF
jgi:hypothetical protein